MTYSNLSYNRYPSGRFAPVKGRGTKIPDVSRVVLFITLGCLLGLIYLVQVTKTNALGYKLNDLQGQAAQLQAKHDDLQLIAAREQNLDRAQQYADDNGLVAIAP